MATTENKVITLEVAKTKLNIALTGMQTSIQSIIDTENKLVYNEDHLIEIKEFIDKGNKAVKALAAKHKELKAPAFAECKAWDASLKLISGEILIPLSKAESKYNKICKEIADRKAKEEAELIAKEAIITLRNNFITTYSQKIAASTNLDDLTAIERDINLETARKDRYKDQLEDFKTDCIAIRELLKKRKEQVKILGTLETKIKEAEISGDDETLFKLEGQKELLNESITEGSINVQEVAVSLSSNSVSAGVQMFPDIKPKRRQWEYEISDIDKLYKENPELVELVPRADKIKELMKKTGEELSAKRKEAGDKKPITEFTVGQIRFYLDAKY